MTRVRSASAAVVTAMLVLAGAAACGRADERANAGGPATSTTAPTGATSTTTGGPATTTTTAPTATTAPGPKGSPTGPTTTAGGTAAGAYPSAITMDVVDNPKLDGFEAATKQRVAKAGLPGASLLVLQHGKLIEQEAWSGYTLDTRVPIASASKWMSASTIMTLVDEGKLDLDKPISTYLDFAKGDFGTITTRQLLSFTSGIPDDDSIPCFADPNISLQDCNRAIAKLKLVHKPGEAFRYGGEHLHVAAGVAEAVSGKGWNDLFAERITGPLGMTNTVFAGAPFNVENRLHPIPSGSGLSTLADYGRFLEMIYHDGVAPDGRRILSHESLVQMQSNQIGDARYAKAASFRMEQKNPYGLGEWLDWVGPDGAAIVLSSDGAFGFRPWYDKQNDIVGVYMVDDHAATGGYSDGDPRNDATKGQIPISGNWVFTDVAEALGGSLPADKDQRPGH